MLNPAPGTPVGDCGIVHNNPQPTSSRIWPYVLAAGIAIVGTVSAGGLYYSRFAKESENAKPIALVIAPFDHMPDQSYEWMNFSNLPLPPEIIKPANPHNEVLIASTAFIAEQLREKYGVEVSTEIDPYMEPNASGIPLGDTYSKFVAHHKLVSIVSLYPQEFLQKLSFGKLRILREFDLINYPFRAVGAAVMNDVYLDLKTFLDDGQGLFGHELSHIVSRVYPTKYQRFYAQVKELYKNYGCDPYTQHACLDGAFFDPYGENGFGEDVAVMLGAMVDPIRYQKLLEVAGGQNGGDILGAKTALAGEYFLDIAEVPFWRDVRESTTQIDDIYSQIGQRYDIYPAYLRVLLPGIEEGSFDFLTEEGEAAFLIHLKERLGFMIEPELMTFLDQIFLSEENPQIALFLKLLSEDFSRLEDDYLRNRIASIGSERLEAEIIELLLTVDEEFYNVIRDLLILGNASSNAINALYTNPRVIRDLTLYFEIYKYTNPKSTAQSFFYEQIVPMLIVNAELEISNLGPWILLANNRAGTDLQNTDPNLRRFAAICGGLARENGDTETPYQKMIGMASESKMVGIVE